MTMMGLERERREERRMKMECKAKENDGQAGGGKQAAKTIGVAASPRLGEEEEEGMVV